MNRSDDTGSHVPAILAVLFALLMVTSSSVGVAGATLGGVSSSGAPGALEETDWITAGHDAARSGENPNATGPTTDVSTRWRYSFTDDTIIEAPPVTADGLVLVPGRESLRAVDTDSGAVVWNRSGLDINSVDIAADLVVTTEIDYSGDEIRVYHLSNGTERWNQTGFQADATVIHDGTIYATRGEYLHAIDLESGVEQWSVDINEDVSNGLSASGEMLFATGEVNNRDYAVYALNASDGSEHWRFEIEGLISMAPVVTGDSVFIGGGGETNGVVYDPRFYRLDRTDGHVQWAFDSNDRPRAAAVADGHVYVGSGNSLHALSVATGERQWIHRLAGSLTHGLSYTSIVVQSPAVAGGTVYAANDRGHVVGLDAATGSTRWEYTLDGETSRPIVAGDRLYIFATADETDHVYALEPSPISVSNYSVSTTSVQPGEAFTAQVTVETIDDEESQYNLSLEATPPLPTDGWVLDWHNGTLAPGESRTLTFDGEITISGAWNVSVVPQFETDPIAGPIRVSVTPGTATTNWPQIGGDGGRSKAIATTAGPTQHAQEAWSLTNFDDNLKPVIADGSVYAVHEQNKYDGTSHIYTLAAYDEVTGESEWEFNVSAHDRIPTGSPSIGAGSVYLFTRPWNFDEVGPNVVDNSLFAINRTDGSLEWSQSFTLNDSTSLDQAPAVGNGRVYVAGGIPEDTDFDANASLLAFDQATGALDWQDVTSAEGETEFYHWATAAEGSVVAALRDEDVDGGTTTAADRLVAFSAAGAHQWSTSGRQVDLQEPPVIRNGTVYVLVEDAKPNGDPIRVLRALNLADGSERWSFSPTYRANESYGWDLTSPTVTDDAVYVHQRLDLDYDTSRLYRLDPQTGAVVWNRQSANLFSQFAVGGILYGGVVGDHHTYLYDLETGEKLTQTDLLSRGHGTARAVANGTMITYADSTTPDDFRVIRNGGSIVYTDLEVDSHVSGIDENVTVTATATNHGAYPRQYDVNLRVSPDDGNAHHWIWNYPNREAMLQPGESTTITWVVELREQGDSVFTLQPVDDGQHMNRHMDNRAGSATVNVGDERDGQRIDFDGPRIIEPSPSSWPKESYDARNTGNNSATAAPTAVGNDTVSWIVNHSSEWTSGPTVVGDTVYAGGYDGGDDSIYAINTTDGSVTWEYPTDGEIEIPPVYASGYLYTAGSRSRMYQFNASTAERLWTFTPGGDIGGITVVDGVAYVTVEYSEYFDGETTSEDRLYALNASTREILWMVDKPSTGYGMATPAVANGTVYVTHDGQGTYAFDAETGVERWNQSIAGQGSRLHSPVVGDGIVYVDDATYSGTDGELFALDATNDGAILWSTEANVDGYTGSSPALAHDTLYFTADGSMRAVNAISGSDLWSTQMCGAAEYSPVVAGGTVVVPMSDSTIRAYDASTGEFSWYYEGYGGESFTPAVVNGLLYATGLENLDDAYWLAALSGGPSATPPDVFDYYGLAVSPTNATVGETVTVEATVRNSGEVECGYSANLTIDGTVEDTSSGPVGPGSYASETVSFTHSFASTGTYNVSIENLPPVQVTVTGAEPDVSVSPESVDFGAVEVGGYGSASFWVENTGTANLDWADSVLLGPDADQFRIQTDQSDSYVHLSPGVSGYVTVAFEPTTGGAKQATLQIQTNDPDTPLYNVSLTAESVSPPAVSVSPTSVDFGDVAVGETGYAAVTVSNDGGSDLSFEGTLLNGSDAFTVSDGDNPTTIPAGANHTLTVTFTPGSTGAASATLEVQTNDSEQGAVAVSLAGNGTIITENRAPVTATDHYVVQAGELLSVGAPGILANDLDPENGPLTATQFTHDGVNGTLESFLANGSFEYRPDPGVSGSDSITYTAEDAAGASTTGIVHIEVLPDPNRAPTAVDDHYAVHAGEWLNISGPGVLANDYDPDGDPISTKYHGNPERGDLTSFFTNGGFAYSTEPWQTGTQTFSYWMEDADGDTDVATVTIDVLAPTNRAPTAVPDTYSIGTDEELTVSAPGVLANDYDIDGDSITTKYHGTPSHGELDMFYTNGGFIYTPDPGFTGTDSFTYWIEDTNGETGYTTIEIVVEPNRRPQVTPDTYSVIAGEWLNVSAPGVLANDYDPDGDAISTRYHGTPSNGSLEHFYSNGGFEYLADQNATGTDTFGYWIEDEHGTEANGAVAIQILQPNSTTPVAVDDHFTITEGQWLNVSAPGVLENDRDPDGDALMAISHGSPGAGDVDSFDSSGSFTYLPEPGQTGPVTFTYQVADANGTESATGTVTIEVLPDPNGSANRPPTALDDDYTVREGEWLNVSAPGVLANDYDSDGDQVTTKYVGDPDDGVLASFVSDGSFAYRPTDGFSGTDSFRYMVEDEHDTEGTWATVTITVIPTTSANRPPAVVDDSYTVLEGEWLNVSAPGVLENDRDPDGDGLSTRYHSTPSNGTLAQFFTNGAFTYRASPGTTGTDSFQYWMEDEHGAAVAPGQVTIEVLPDPNRPPRAVPDAYVVRQGETLTIEAPGVLANDGDVDGDAVSVRYHGNPTDGELPSFYGSGGFEYTPDPGFVGVDTVTYIIEDEHGLQASTAVTITVLEATITGYADIAVPGEQLEFGPVQAGTTATESITVANVGDANLTVSGATLSGQNASDFTVVSGNGTTVLAYGETGSLGVQYAPTTVGTAEATLTVHSDDPDEGTLTVPIVASSEDREAPTIESVSVSGTSETSTPNETVVYENETVVIDVVASDGYHEVDHVGVTLRAAGANETVTRTASDSGTGTWTRSIDVSELPEGPYTLRVLAIDDAGNRQTTVANATVVVDRTPPNLAAAAAGTAGSPVTVSLTASEALQPGTVSLELAHNGTTQSVAMTGGNDTWTGTTTGSGPGEYTLTATGIDRAGNRGSDTATASLVTGNTTNNTVTVLTGAGFVRVHTNESVNGSTVSITNSTVPIGLGAGQAGLVVFDVALEATLDETVTYGTIGVPVNGTALPTGVEPDDVAFWFFNETRSAWQAVPTIIESVTVNGTSELYWVGTVPHFSTYGLVATDTIPPSVTATSPADGGQLASGTTSATLRMEVGDVFAGIDVDETVVVYDGLIVTEHPATTITGSAVEFLASGLTDGSSHAFSVHLQDHAGNTHTEQVDFSVGTTAPPPPPAPSSGGSFDGARQEPTNGSLSIEPTADGFVATISDGEAGDTFSRTLADGALGQTGVRVAALSVTLHADGDHELPVAGQQTHGTPLPSALGEPMVYVTGGDTDVATTTLRLAVDESWLVSRDLDASALQVYRLEDGTWTAIESGTTRFDVDPSAPLAIATLVTEDEPNDETPDDSTADPDAAAVEPPWVLIGVGLVALLGVGGLLAWRQFGGR